MSTGVSAIVPTIGRAASLRALLESLETQTCRVDEIIVADSSDDDETDKVVINNKGLPIRHVRVHSPNAVRQRLAR